MPSAAAPPSPAPLRVLVADDDASSRLVLARSLSRWGYEVQEAADGTQALAILQSADPPQLAIIDWMMPGSDGPDICRQGRRRPDASGYTYIIMLTSRSENRDVVDGLGAGADDYVVKPFQLTELEARVRVGRRIVELESRLRAERAEFQHRAQHDALTGIWNRHAMMDELERELGRSKRERRCVAVLMLDLDHFKNVNDTHGHGVGDEVLIETGRRLKASLRSYDAIARMGGEEFVALVTCRDVGEAREAADRVRTSSGGRPFETTAGPLTITLSAGVATSDARGYHREALLLAADRALYRAKKSGRNRVEIDQTETEAVTAAP
ncbi:MAG TPA: diguanylate cyclase [Polyangia bacterium]